MKAIYISIGYLTEKVARDWCLSFLIEKGVEVEYWEVVASYREEYFEPERKRTSYVRSVDSMSTLQSLINRPENKKALFFLLMHVEGRFLKLFQLLAENDCKTYFINWGATPFDGRISPVQKMRDRLVNPARTLRNGVDKAKTFAYRHFHWIKPIHVVFTAGRVLLNTRQYADKVVPVNLCDYDHYVRVRKKNERLIAGDYIVFLDQNLPLHADYALWGWPNIGASAYYRSLNRFFEMLEKHWSTQVVIAAHPQSDYDRRVFEGRLIYRLVTAEVIKHANLVIAHDSTAISFAVLNKKPILFIYTQEMMTSYEHTEMKILNAFADYLGYKPINVDKLGTVEQISVGEVNCERYDNYKYDFLTSADSEDKTTEEIVWGELCAIK